MFIAVGVLAVWPATRGDVTPDLGLGWQRARDASSLQSRCRDRALATSDCGRWARNVVPGEGARGAKEGKEDDGLVGKHSNHVRYVYIYTMTAYGLRSSEAR